MNKTQSGKVGEDIAAEYMEWYCMDILERNYRYGKSEIDIIAKDGDTLCFTEVKARSAEKFGKGAEAVNVRKQQLLIAGAKGYCTEHNCFDSKIRFDIAEVDLCRGEVSAYIRNAFCEYSDYD